MSDNAVRFWEKGSEYVSPSVKSLFKTGWADINNSPSEQQNAGPSDPHWFSAVAAGPHLRVIQRRRSRVNENIALTSGFDVSRVFNLNRTGKYLSPAALFDGETRLFPCFYMCNASRWERECDQLKAHSQTGCCSHGGEGIANLSPESLHAAEWQRYSRISCHPQLFTRHLCSFSTARLFLRQKETNKANQALLVSR